MEELKQTENHIDSENNIEAGGLITIAPKTSLVIEVVGGLFGFMGFGWFLSNKKRIGLLLLLGYFLFRGITILLSAFNRYIIFLNFPPIIFSVIFLYFESRKVHFKTVQIPSIIPIFLEAIGAIAGIVGLGWLFVNKNKLGIFILGLYTILRYLYKQYAVNLSSGWYFLINASLCTISIIGLYIVTNRSKARTD
jgi:hypothetical protein